MNPLQVTEEQIEQIRLYLSGQASPELQAELEARMAVEAAFAEEVENFRFLMQGLKSLHAKNMKTKLSDWEKERKQTQEPLTSTETPPAQKGRVISMKRWYTYASLAAVVLLLVIFVSNWGLQTQESQSYDQLLAENLTEVPMPSLMRGGKAPADSIALWYRTGISYYVMKKYALATPFLAKCAALENLPETLQSAELDLYLGIAYLQSGKTAQAKQTLEKLPNIGVYPSHKDWFLAMTTLQAHDTAQVKSLLRQIARQPDHMYQKKANVLLKSLPTSAH